LSVHQRVDILQAFLVNDTRRKFFCKNTFRSQRVNKPFVDVSEWFVNIELIMMCLL